MIDISVIPHVLFKERFALPMSRIYPVSEVGVYKRTELKTHVNQHECIQLVRSKFTKELNSANTLINMFRQMNPIKSNTVILTHLEYS